MPFFFESIHNFNTKPTTHPLRNIVLKLFDDKCKAKAYEILRGDYTSRLGIFIL